ncbi:Alpha/Beta hydrolase protein [Mycena olivaceomarginata]|nr:Alpha/Beta hydrolase protein [Mycena olivaceomarginata]
MHSHNHSLIGAAAAIPVNDAKPIISFSPVVLSTPERAVNLELRVTVPAIGDALPIVLLAHGQGMSNWLSSLEGYAPLAEFWAAHGFAVLGLKSPPGQELFWQERSTDMVRILDNLDVIEDAVPGLRGRLDRSRITVAGHSAGSWTPARVKAGVFLAGVGNGGADLSEMGRTVLVPFFGPDFSRMERPLLVVCGDQDVGPHLTVRGADWHADAYLGTWPEGFGWLKSGKHGLGGIACWDAAETTDESPQMLGAVQRMTWAYLRSQLYGGDGAWAEACKSLAGLKRWARWRARNR